MNANRLRQLGTTLLSALAGIFTVALTASNSVGTSPPFALELIIFPPDDGP